MIFKVSVALKLSHEIRKKIQVPFTYRIIKRIIDLSETSILNDGRKSTLQVYVWPLSDLSGCVSECSISGEPLFLKCPVSDFDRLISYQMKLHKYLKVRTDIAKNRNKF